MTVELVFDERGAGPPLVVLHGLFGAKRNWATIAKALAPHHRVLTVDLRNHGASPWDAVHDYPALAGDVARFIHTHVGGPAAVLGHSMGGKAAMVLAFEEPGLVERLVVVDIPPAASRTSLIDALRAMQQVPLAACTRRGEVDAALAESIADPAVRAFLVQNVTAGPNGLAWAVNLDAIAHNFPAIVGFPDVPAGRTFSGPTLFVVGERSDYVRPEHHAAIHRLFPAATVEVVTGAGHWVHAEAPDAFLAVVSGFLSA
ncbi:MAG: alpha/beta fold hydrolase [Pirellulales bacterium]|jgi:pimeloyl-ACP methyl ester carboxylesterase